MGLEVIATESQGLQFGVYLEDVECIVLNGNTIAENMVNIGYDGLTVSTINGNTFRVFPGTTKFHIKGFGNAHTSGRNQDVTISDNAFHGNVLQGVTGDPKSIVFYPNAGASSGDDTHMICKSNVRAFAKYALVPGTGNTTTLVFDPNYDFLVYASGCTDTIKLSSSWAGQEFVIHITGVTTGTPGTHLTIQLETAATYDGAKTPVVKAGVAYDVATHKYTFSVNGAYRFIPLGDDINEYMIV
jgi:hypothetical protein